MQKRIAINGFGRIGKTFLRTIFQKSNNSDLDIVAINIGPGNIEQTALLFKYDSVMGAFDKKVEVKDDFLLIDGKKIQILKELDPEKLPWRRLNINWVVEATGIFKTREKANLHLKAGAKKVLITAPSSDADTTIIPGINDNDYNPEKDTIVSLGSCTTNCFAPIIKILKENFTLEMGMMTTIHSYTNDQVLLDIEHKDPRRARAAALNIIPTKTGAQKVIMQIYPELENKILACSIRVPTAYVSLVDFTFTTKEKLSTNQINKLFKEYSKEQLKNILEFCDKPLVSSDFKKNSHSCIFDSLLTKSTENMGKIFGWYDNEFGYCCRLKDFLLHN